MNKKLDLFPTEEEQVLIFLERVKEAIRITNYELKDLVIKRNKLKKYLDFNQNVLSDDDYLGDKKYLRKRKRKKWK